MPAVAASAARLPTLAPVKAIQAIFGPGVSSIRIAVSKKDKKLAVNMWLSYGSGTRLSIALGNSRAQCLDVRHAPLFDP
jgi:hypothetical protein